MTKYSSNEVNKNTRTQTELVDLFFSVFRQLKQRMTHDGSNDLNIYHYQALFVLLNKPQTMSEMAENLSVTQPSASALVERLVKHGWVERSSDEGDRRIIRLTLTKSGSDLIKKKREERKKEFHALLDALPPEDIDSLHRIFNKLKRSLENKKED